MTPTLTISAGDVGAASAILIAAARRLETRGETLWPPSSLSPERLIRHYPSQSWVVAWQESRAVACCSLLESNPLFWPDDGPLEALYLHKLAVHPEVQGRGLAAWLLNWAAAEAARRGRPALKLDTASDRPRLRAMYEGLGFGPVGVREVMGFSVTLYQRRV